jgi:hypothetical protein
MGVNGGRWVGASVGTVLRHVSHAGSHAVQVFAIAVACAALLSCGGRRDVPVRLELDPAQATSREASFEIPSRGYYVFEVLVDHHVEAEPGTTAPAPRSMDLQLLIRGSGGRIMWEERWHERLSPGVIGKRVGRVKLAKGTYSCTATLGPESLLAGAGERVLVVLHRQAPFYEGF